MILLTPLSILEKIKQSILKVDNEVVVNLRTVQWAKLTYVNQYNQEVNKIPKYPTLRLERLTNDYILQATGMPRETQLEKAVRLEVVDQWLPVLYLQLTANHKLKFTGDKALSLWEAWKAKQYGKTNIR